MYIQGSAENVMRDPNDSVREKVSAIFRELAGSRERELGASVESIQTKRAIAAALVKSYDADTAEKVALHMSDWNSEAAFIVALHLFPERFTPEEIEAGIGFISCARAQSYTRGLSAYRSICLGGFSL